MAEAVALGAASRGRTAPNPNVGCLIASADGTIASRGATQPGGRPHAEAVALLEAGTRARGAIVHVTLEPCAHQSERGPACADLLVEAAPAGQCALTDRIRAPQEQVSHVSKMPGLKSRSVWCSGSRGSLQAISRGSSSAAAHHA